MCCSVTPGVPVRFSNTILYAAEMNPFQDEPIHVLGYQNRVQGRVGLAQWLPWGSVGNAMILPFPAVPGTMTQANVINMANDKAILQHLAAAVSPPRSLGTPTRPDGLSSGPVQIFEAADIYTVILAQDPRDIPAVLEFVPPQKRPTLNPQLFAAYAQWYPGWTIALCCFNNREEKSALPLLWWYRPMDPDYLFMPALDSTSGTVPDLEAEVEVDHTIVVGSSRLKEGVELDLDIDKRPSLTVAPFISRRLLGKKYQGRMANGDFRCRTAEVAAGMFNLLRSLPPGS